MADSQNSLSSSSERIKQIPLWKGAWRKPAYSRPSGHSHPGFAIDKTVRTPRRCCAPSCIEQDLGQSLVMMTNVFLAGEVRLVRRPSWSVVNPCYVCMCVNKERIWGGEHSYLGSLSSPQTQSTRSKVVYEIPPVWEKPGLNFLLLILCRHWSNNQQLTPTSSSLFLSQMDELINLKFRGKMVEASV